MAGPKKLLTSSKQALTRAELAESLRCVYNVCMARLNVYVPDELAERARRANLNVSALTQAAIAAELRRRSTNEWLASVPCYSPVVGRDEAMAALDAARDEIGGYE